MTKENQRVAISKKLLKEALFKILQKKNISEISIRELCDEAEINRTTFYRHYSTPRDVLLEIAEDFLNVFTKKGHALSKDGDTPLRHITALCEYMFENKATVTLFIRNLTDSDFTTIYQGLFDDFLSVKTLSYKGNKVDNETLCLLNTMFFCGAYAAIRQWIIDDIPKSPQEIAELICGFFNSDISFS